MTSEDTPRSIDSRELAGHLYKLAGMLEGQVSLFRFADLGLSGRFEACAEDVSTVAAWLYDAKFVVRDPYRLRVAVRDAIAGWKTIISRPDMMQRAMEDLEKEFEPYKL